MLPGGAGRGGGSRSRLPRAAPRSAGVLGGVGGGVCVVGVEPPPFPQGSAVPLPGMSSATGTGREPPRYLR